MTHPLLQTKAATPDKEFTELKRCLTAVDLIFLGVGGTIGAGIFVLTGIAAANDAGPAIILSYILAGIACSFAALSYSELSSSIGGSGSAYNYAYVGLGEIFAWIIGWDLILEYAAGAVTVAIGWSGYMNNALTAIGLPMPESLQKGPFEGGMLNLSALLIVLALTLLLALGLKKGARFNVFVVIIKLAVIAVFIVAAIPNVNWENWENFMPFGWQGVASGAGLVFFAYIGFDAVSTAAEEAVNPQRDLSIGILGSLIICTIAYIAVSGLLTAIAPYSTLNVSSPVAETLLKLGHKFTAGLVAFGAIAGLTSVILIFIYALSRIFYAISRDGLLPSFFSQIHPKTQTPVRVLLVSGTLVAITSAITPLRVIAELVNIGTLAAFIIVCAGVIVLRHTKPELPRPFKTPFVPYIPALGIIFCSILMFSLPLVTWVRFIAWMGLGLIVYFIYGRNYSKLRRDLALKT